MTLTQMLANMTGVELSHRMGLDQLRSRERASAQRIADAKRRR